MAPVTVLMTLMSLEIGGAETHAVVLARHLKENGYRVLMASNGGAFEEIIAAYGIEHYRLPLDNYGLRSLYRSLTALKSIIRAENVALVHAHARIPAFVSDLASRLTGVHLVTTAHAMFSAGFPLNHISRWGEKTIAISHDVREHLLQAFGLPEANIVLIPNGIDLEVFRPDLPTNEVLDELGLNSDQILIAYVSRLDEWLAPVAVNLMEACGKLYAEFPSLRLLIAGDGNQAGVVAERALALNAAMGRDFIHVLGARTDVNRIMAAVDLVVGVSRVALEAMACGKNVLLAGGEGYGGLVQEGSLHLFSKDNFTGRQFHNQAAVQNFVQTLQEFLLLPAERKKNIGLLLREFIAEHHSSKHMAKETAKVYHRVLSG